MASEMTSLDYYLGTLESTVSLIVKVTEFTQKGVPGNVISNIQESEYIVSIVHNLGGVSERAFR